MPTVNTAWLSPLLLEQPTECGCRERRVGKTGHEFIHEMDAYREKKLEIVSHWSGKLRALNWVNCICEAPCIFPMFHVHGFDEQSYSRIIKLDE